MALSLFDQQLFEKVVDEKYKDKKEFTRTEVLIILNEMTKAEKYYPKGHILKGAKYKVFKYFVRYCLYRSLANYDTMVLLSGNKGCLSGDTLIKTTKGNIPIKELIGLVDLKSLDMQTNSIIESLGEVFPTGEQEVYEIEFEDGEKELFDSNQIVGGKLVTEYSIGDTIF